MTGALGEVISSEGKSAVFALDVRDGRIVAAAYRSSTCATLVAACEHIAESVRGSALPVDITVERLLAECPEIPAERYDSVRLAVKAFTSALLAPQ